MSEPFWQKDSLVTHIFFDLCLFKPFCPVANFEQQSIAFFRASLVTVLKALVPQSHTCRIKLTLLIFILCILQVRMFGTILLPATFIISIRGGKKECCKESNRIGFWKWRLFNINMQLHLNLSLAKLWHKDWSLEMFYCRINNSRPFWTVVHRFAPCEWYRWIHWHCLFPKGCSGLR